MGTIQIDGSTPKITVGNATAEDATILFDGNAQDFYIALDDSADDLLIGLGSTVGTTPAISIDENLAVKTYGDITMTGTTPTLTIGDAGAEDTAIIFDGNAQDFYIALDDSADDLLIGKGSTVGTTPAIAIDENLKVNIPVTTASTSASTGSLTTGGGMGVGADLYVGDDTYLITDSAVLGFGADKDTLLTHTDGTGLTLNSTNKLCFNDTSQFVQGISATVLGLGATDEIDLTATAIDINGTCDISGTFSLGGTNITTTAAEINLIDGGTARGTTAIADGDGVLINDGGTMRQTTVQTLATYIGGGGLVLLASASCSDDSTKTIVGANSSTYQTVLVTFSKMIPASDDQAFKCHLLDASDNRFSAYAYTGYGGDDGSTALTRNDGGGSVMDFMNNVGSDSNEHGVSGQMWLHQASGATQASFNCNLFGVDADDCSTVLHLAGMVNNSSAAFNGVEFFFQSGNIESGEMRMYGLVNA